MWCKSAEENALVIFVESGCAGYQNFLFLLTTVPHSYLYLCYSARSQWHLSITLLTILNVFKEDRAEM